LAPISTTPSWGDLEVDARADEGDSVELEAVAETELGPGQAGEEDRVAVVEHPVLAHESPQLARLAPERRRRPAHVDGRCRGRGLGEPLLRRHRIALLHRGSIVISGGDP
jgi:hypothetical protein